MALYKNVNGKRVKMTQAEEDATLAAREASIAKELLVTPEMVITERIRRIEAGASIVVAPRRSIPATGTEADKMVLTNLALAAQARIAGGSTEGFAYRDRDSVIQNLSPEEALQLWSSGMAWIEAVHGASWNLEAMDPIPEDYTDDSWWPSDVVS